MATINKLKTSIINDKPTSFSKNDKISSKAESVINDMFPANKIIYGPSKINASSYSDYNDYIRDLSIENSSRNFKFNEVEAEKARNWQTEMSNTSHQREVEDLKKAGLNPVLSANSGAMSYSASSASGSGVDPSSAMSAIYMQKMNNANAVKIAKMNNSNNLKMAKLQSSAALAGSLASASASRYASDQAYLASIYGTDHSKYGLIDSAINSLLGGSSNTGIGNAVKGIKGALKNGKLDKNDPAVRYGMKKK